MSDSAGDAWRALMLADLSNFRRDYISAPEDDRDRNINRQRDADALQNAQDRSANIIQGAVSRGGNADLLAKWNTPSNFDADPVAKTLTSMAGGQGHRQALSQLMEGRRGNTNLQGAFEHPRRFGSARSLRAPQAPDCSSPVPASTLRANRVRAPSPRAAQTVRFLNGRRIVPSTISSSVGAARQAVTKPATADTAAGLPHKSMKQQKVVRTSQPVGPDPQAQAGPSPSAQGVSSSASMASTARSSLAQPIAPPAAIVTPSVKSSSFATVVPAAALSEAQIQDPVLVQHFLIRAKSAIATPRAFDRYMREFPERANIGRKAARMLAKEAVAFAEDPEDEVASAHIKQFSNRLWLFEAAVDVRAGKAVDTSEHIIQEIVKLTPKDAIQAAPVKQDEPETANSKAKEALTADQTAAGDIAAQNSSSDESLIGTTQSSSSTASKASSEAFAVGLTHGHLTAIFYDAFGNLLGNLQSPVSVPVQAHVTLTSRSAVYNPLVLANEMRALARQMQDREHSKPGFRRTMDDLWKEGDDEEF